MIKQKIKNFLRKLYRFLIFLLHFLIRNIALIYFNVLFKPKKIILPFFEKLTKNDYENLDATKRNIIKKANQILKNKFDILGLDHKLYPEKINWHKDFKTGFEWDKSFFKYLQPVSSIDDIRDKKIPWDLSRLQFLFILYKAYTITEKKVYLDKIIYLINNWIDNNPPYIGINWMNAMEVGLRASNLTLILSYINPLISKKLIKKIQKSLLMHFCYIKLNLEKSRDKTLADLKGLDKKYLFRNNHYFFNLLGLFYISSFFDNNKIFKKERLKSIQAISDELNFQILKDGSNFEGSIGYHGFMLESLIQLIIFCDKRKIEVPYNIKITTKKMLNFTSNYTKPDSNFPIIGDFDSGYVFAISKTVQNSHQHLIEIGSILFDKNYSSFKKVFFQEYIKWMFKSKCESYNDSIDLVSNSFLDSGTFIIRNEDDYLILSSSNAIKNGTGGHFHNDCFSFELYSKGTNYIIDPGCYLYSSKYWRNLFRSSKFHNAPVINNSECNKYDEDKLFYMPNDVKSELNTWLVDKEKVLFSGSHYGYFKDYSIKTTRDISYNYDSQWLICDIFDGNGIHNIDWFFHFPDIKIKILNNKSLIAFGKKSNLKMNFIIDTDDCKLIVKKSYISKGYGKKSISNLINFNSNFNLKNQNKLNIEIKVDNFN